MWFALDSEPKYFAKSDGLPLLVHVLVSQNYFIKPLRAMHGRKVMSEKKPKKKSTSHFLSDSAS